MHYRLFKVNWRDTHGKLRTSRFAALDLDEAQDRLADVESVKTIISINEVAIDYQMSVLEDEIDVLEDRKRRVEASIYTKRAMQREYIMWKRILDGKATEILTVDELLDSGD